MPSDVTLYNDSSNFQEIKEKQKNKLDDIRLNLSPFELAISDLFVWYEDQPQGWRVHLKYRDLFACLTPRQIKSFLRERLLAAKDPDGSHPLESMLSTLFHPVWKLWRDEKALFIVLAQAAGGAIEISRSTTRHGKLSGPAADYFHLQLQATAQKASVLSDEDMRACWPRKSEERALLVHLLALMIDYCRMPPYSSQEKLPAQGMSLSSTDRMPFVDWVYRKLGDKPTGITPVEQVSSFQDLASAKYRKGEKDALEAVKEYADLYLAQHTPYFSAPTAASLSNLAVLINHIPGWEPQCDSLFRAAIELARPDSSIPFYYVEFLLDVVQDERRSQWLGGKNNTEQKANEILDNIADDELSPMNRLFREILKQRLNAKNTNDRENRMAMVWELVKRHRLTLLTGGREPSSRLNDLLDAVIGKGGTALKMKEPLQGMVWAAQIASGQPGWPMVIQLANDLVGESSGNSPEERIGMRLDAALVADSSLLSANENQRLSAVWSQAVSILSQRMGPAAQSRIALASLVSQAYGGSAQSFDRMNQAWTGLGRHGPADWAKLLDEEHRQLVDKLGNKIRNPEEMAKLRDIVFGDYQPITTPDKLAQDMGWMEEKFIWAGGKNFDGAVAELVKLAKSVELEVRDGRE